MILGQSENEEQTLEEIKTCKCPGLWQLDLLV